MNSFVTDAVLMKTDDVVASMNTFKGHTLLKKLYAIVQGLHISKREAVHDQINTLIIDAEKSVS